MTTPAAERTAPLTQDIRAMLAAEMPGLARLNGHLALIDVTPHEQDPTRIDITVQPVDFQADTVTITASLRIDSIARLDPPPLAITAGSAI